MTGRVYGRTETGKAFHLVQDGAAKCNPRYILKEPYKPLLEVMNLPKVRANKHFLCLLCR